MLRNNESYWLHEKDEGKALKQYLELGDRVYNKTKFTLMRRLKVNIYASFLHKFDLLFGTRFPFNRLGWNIIVRAKKVV